MGFDTIEINLVLIKVCVLKQFVRQVTTVLTISNQANFVFISNETDIQMGAGDHTQCFTIKQWKSLFAATPKLIKVLEIDFRNSLD